MTLPPEVPLGLSGLTRDDRGAFWAVAENAHQLVRFTVERGSFEQLEVFALEGIPPSLELESIAWLGDNSFAIGSETDRANRISDSILFVSLVGEVGHVTKTVELNYEAWSVAPHPNQGIEAVCANAEHLVVGGEPVLAGTKRRAPLALYNLRTGHWTHSSLRLSSAKGKLAGLSCDRLQGQNLELVAIERDFEVHRVIRSNLKNINLPSEVEVEEVVEVGTNLNIEGIARTTTGLALITDNQFHGRSTGATQLLFIDAFD